LFPVTRNSSNLREEDKRRLLFKTGSVAMNFGEFQEVVDQWIQGHGRYWSKFEIVARLIEDLGEISRTLQHTEGLRTGKDELKVADDIGDLLFTLAAFANANGLRLEDCVDGVMEKYRTRESTEW
jgi:NTP pyrophosphatase (non-canonical NTP hydrolase)